MKVYFKYKLSEFLSNPFSINIFNLNNCLLGNKESPKCCLGNRIKNRRCLHLLSFTVDSELIQLFLMTNKYKTRWLFSISYQSHTFTSQHMLHSLHFPFGKAVDAQLHVASKHLLNLWRFSSLFIQTSITAPRHFDFTLLFHRDVWIVVLECVVVIALLCMRAYMYSMSFPHMQVVFICLGLVISAACAV